MTPFSPSRSFENISFIVAQVTAPWLYLLRPETSLTIEMRGKKKQRGALGDLGEGAKKVIELEGPMAGDGWSMFMIEYANATTGSQKPQNFSKTKKRSEAKKIAGSPKKQQFLKEQKINIIPKI